MKSRIIAFAVAIAWVGTLWLLHASATGAAAPATEAALSAKEVGAKLFPERVFFRGQLAPTQLRNTAGIHFSDDLYLLAGLCDSAGYAADVRQKFQGYLLSEVPIELGGKSLPPGAYAFGFLSGGQFVMMDIGARDLFQIPSTKDTEIKRPMPVQVLPASAKGSYRLYGGRDYVELHRAQ